MDNSVLTKCLSSHKNDRWAFHWWRNSFCDHSVLHQLQWQHEICHKPWVSLDRRWLVGFPGHRRFAGNDLTLSSHGKDSRTTNHRSEKWSGKGPRRGNLDWENLAGWLHRRGGRGGGILTGGDGLSGFVYGFEACMHGVNLVGLKSASLVVCSLSILLIDETVTVICAPL